MNSSVSFLKIILTLVLWSCIFPDAWSQHDWVWTTADSVVIKFQGGGAPVLDTTRKSAMFIEAGACYSDSEGELLYFSNHDAVYNKDGQPMAYGYFPFNISLKSITQGVFVIPSPMKEGELIQFLFSDDCSSSTIYCPMYLEIAPKDSGGLGLVKNINILPYLGSSDLTEKLTGVPHADGKSWWVLYHDEMTNEFIEYFVNFQGVFPPIKRSIGSIHSSNFSAAMVGEMTFSPDGTKLLVVSMSGIVDLFDFNRCTGEISNWQNLGMAAQTVAGPHTYYGCSFSPDGTKAYVSEIWNDTTGNRVFQYDLNASDILASKTLIFTAPFQVFLGQHQLGPDGKIYIAHLNQYSVNDLANFHLSVIHNPNAAGPNCNFSYLDFWMGGREGILHLPNLPNFNTGPLHAQTAEGGPSHLICPGDSVQLGVPDTTGGLVSYTWTPAVGLSDPNSSQPMASPPATRMYYLQVVDSAFGLSCGVTRDSVLVRVATAQEMPQALAGPDTMICPGGSATIGAADSSVSGWTYAWSPAAQVANPSAPVSSASLSGQYVLSVSNPISTDACFSDQDTVLVSIYDPSFIPAGMAGSDSVICSGDTLQLGIGNAPGSWIYQWLPAGSLDNPGIPRPLAAPTQSTNYYLSASDSMLALPCAMIADSVYITVEQPLSHPAPPSDLTFCPGECFEIGVAERQGLIYNWSPIYGLDNPQGSLTRAQPSTTTTYTLTITDPAKQSANCRELRFAVTTTADDCNFQTVLWPNGDGVAEVLDFGDYDGPMSLEVYDVQGRLVYRNEEYRNDWDGGGISHGVYLYRLTLGGECGFVTAGKVVLMR